MATIRRNINAKHGYEYVTDDNRVIEITSKTTDGFLKLPEIVNGRKLISLKVLNDCETYDLSTLPTRAPRTKIDLTQYYTPEEKAQIEKLQSKINKINDDAMARAQKDIKMAELTESLKALDPESLKSIVATLMGGEA